MLKGGVLFKVNPGVLGLGHLLNSAVKRDGNLRNKFPLREAVGAGMRRVLLAQGAAFVSLGLADSFVNKGFWLVVLLNGSYTDKTN